MDKKANSSINTTLNSSSSDSYWLACIAHNQQNELAAKKQVPQSSHALRESPHALLERLAESPLAAEIPAIKSYPPNPANSFWLKQVDSPHRNPAADNTAERDLGKPQGNTRVSIPADIVYTAIIDDGQTHHVAWGIRNMSLSGVFLDMNISHLREGMAVDFLLRYALKGRALSRRITARVVRTQLNGLALQFIHYDTSTYQDLVRLLYAP